MLGPGSPAGHGLPMLSALLEVVVPVFLVVTLGYLYASRRTFPVTVITDLIIYVCGPCLVFEAFAGAEPFPADRLRIPLTAVLVTASGVGVGFLAQRTVPALRGLRAGVVALPVTFMNAGNMGLPIAQLAFGAEGLEIATLYFVSYMVMMYAVGIPLAAGHPGLGAVLRIPMIHATWIGILANQWQVSLPDTISIPMGMLSRTVVPLMLIALGARLRGLVADRSEMPRWSAVAVLVALRLGGGVGLAALVNLLLGNEGLLAKISLLIGGLPPAVMTFALVESYGRDTRASATVSAAIAMGTGLALLYLPLLVSAVSGPTSVTGGP